MNIYIPFTYLIGWSQQNKYYYGVRFKLKTDPSTLWTTYFTSSKQVKKFRERYGEPDVVQVRQCFYNKEDAIKWEQKLLRRINDKSKFLNLAFGTLQWIDNTGKRRKPVSEEGRSNMRAAQLGKKRGPHSDEHKRKIGEANKGRKLGPKNPEAERKRIESRKGYVHSEETKQKIKDAWVKKKLSNP